MKKADITQTIVLYLAKNYKNLKGAMPEDNYFSVGGASINEFTGSSFEVCKGTAVDILADTIEKKKFFGWHLDESVEQADNPNNAKLCLLKDGSEVYGTFKIRLMDSGVYAAKPALQIDVREVKPKAYLDNLRTPEGFKASAQLLGIDKNLANITRRLYATK